LTPFQHEIRPERLSWFLYLRWGAVVGALAILLAGPWLVPMAIQYGKIGVCVLILGVLNAFYLIYWEKLKSTRTGSPDFAWKVHFFLHFQMATDLALLTAMLFFSGGAKNPLILFYLFHLAISAILFTQAESLFYAAVALLLPWLLYVLEWGGILSADPWPGISGISNDHELSVLLAYSVAVAGLWFFLSRLGLDVDIKEQALRETGEKLQTANEALKQLDVYKNQFLKQVVFQLKKPAIEMDFDLSAVESALESKNEKGREAIQTAKKRIWILLELIEDLVWLSRTQAGEVPLKKIWVNVYETLLQRIQAVEDQARQKGIIFQLHGDAQARLLADPASFERVADNLFSNAIKYTPAGKSHVAVNFHPEGNWLVITVEDEGIGIPPKQQKKLFQEFFRATNAKTMEKFGTGLGLSIVKEVMDLHGGRVTLSSEPKKGTKVETWWPLTAIEPAPPA
jgi:signal transduction histidine kinase